MTKTEKQVAEIHEAIAGLEKPINEAKACEFLGISRQTMRQYVSEGKMAGTFIINKIGKRMFYESKLINQK